MQKAEKEKSNGIEDKKKFYRDIAEADMFERDVARLFDKYISEIREIEEYLRAKGNLFITSGRSRVLCSSCFFLHMIKDSTGLCRWRNHSSNEECALRFARIWTEILWERNGRGL